MSITIDGRFFHLDGEPLFVNAITYGPFPANKKPNPASEFPRIAKAGFNAIRTYHPPDQSELDLAQKNNLLILPIVTWPWDSLFTEHPDTITDAKQNLSTFLQQHSQHPALGALIIANEIRPDLVRFMDPLKVRKILEDLINTCRQQAPHLIFAYANFPTTEYLEPRNADFTAFNVYLEQPNHYRDYLRRLHNIAGDRPVLLTEFGYNTYSHSSEPLSDPALEAKQAEMLNWAYQIAREEGVAGFTVYSWSDLWFNGGREILDWSFGVTRRDGSEKPALAVLSRELAKPKATPHQLLSFTIAICTRNGGQRLQDNLPSFENIKDDNFEILIIDDGSTDNTQQIVETFIATTSLSVRLLSQKPSGLSAARNLAAHKSSAEFIAYIDDDARPHPDWLQALRKAFAHNPHAAAAGGPNLAPAPISRQNAIVTACAGNASHILFTDTTAEHLPGCNFALQRKILLEIGGFDEIFHAAGDDVDLCWRLLDAGHELAFHPTACVFHDRRLIIKDFLRQQRGYGEAEALLFHKHPQRFGSNGIRWQGFIYTGSPLTIDLGAVIYHGPMGSAPFQMLQSTHMPIRPLSYPYDTKLNRKIVTLTEKLAYFLRRKTRKQFKGPSEKAKKTPLPPKSAHKETRRDFYLNEGDPRSRVLQELQNKGWKISPQEDQADLERGPLSIIFAQTPDLNNQSTLHLRLHHPPIEITSTLREIEETIKPPPH